MEWTVVTVLIALVGLGGAVVRPLLALNASIVKLTVRLDQMMDSLSEISERNTRSHDRLWKKNEEQDAVLDNHEHRITVLEERNPPSV